MAVMQERGPVIGQRHILVLSAGAGLGILFSMRMCLPVALVAMVIKNSTSKGHDYSVNTSCPIPVTNFSSADSASQVYGEFDWSPELQGFILGAFFWGYLFLQIPAGNLAQRYGGKWFTCAGIAWCSLFCLLTPIAARTSPYLLIVLLFLQGLGSSFTCPSMFAMFGRWFPPQENSGLTTIAYSGPYFGTMIGQIVSGVVSSSAAMGGWPTVFYLNAAVGIMWAVMWSLLVSNSPTDNKLISEAEKKYIVNSVNTDQDAANKRGVPWCRLLSRPLVVFVLLYFCMGLISFSLMVCLPRFLSDVLHQEVAATGYLASLPILAQVIMANVFTQIADALRRRNWMSKKTCRRVFTLIGFWSSGICLLCVTFAGCSVVFIEVLLVIASSALMSLYAGFVLFPLDVFPEYSGTVFGMGNSSMTAAGLIAPIAIGFIAADGSREAWARVYYVSFAITAASGVLYLLFGSSERQSWDQADKVDEEEVKLKVEVKEEEKNEEEEEKDKVVIGELEPLRS